MNFPKLKHPEYKKMYEVLKDNLSPYYSKGILSVLVINFFKYILVLFGLSPIFKASLSQTVSSQTYLFSLIFSAILVFLARIICEILNFGLVIYFSNAIVSKNAKFTDCFTGFHKFGSHPYKIGTIFALISAFAILIDFVLFFSFKDFFSFNFPAEINQQNIQDVFANSVKNYYPKVLILTFVFGFVYYAIKMFFIFTWSVLRDFSSGKTRQIFKKNFMMIYRNYFHFIGFNFYINFKNIIILIVCYVIQFALQQNISEKLELLSALLNFLVFIEEFTILAKIYSSIPIYYYSLLSVNNLIKAHSLKIIVDDDVNSHDGSTEIFIDDSDDAEKFSVSTAESSGKTENSSVNALESSGKTEKISVSTTKLSGKTEKSSVKSAKSKKSAEKDKSDL